MVSVEIDTYDSHLVLDLMDVTNTTALQAGYQRSIAGDATLTYQKTIVRKAFGVPETLDLVLTIGSSVAANVISSWLYDKLKGRKATLRIDKKEIQIEKGEIVRIIEEKVQNPD